MYSPDLLHDIWNFELFLFGGIPEEEEAIFERVEDMNGSYDPRPTRQSSPADSNAAPSSTGDGVEREVLFYWQDDAELGDIVYSTKDPE